MKKILVAAMLAVGIIGGQAAEAVITLYNTDCDHVLFKISSSATVTSVAGTLTDISSTYPPTATVAHKFYKIEGINGAASIPDGATVWIQAWKSNKGSGFASNDSTTAQGYKIKLDNKYSYRISANYVSSSNMTHMTISTTIYPVP